MFFRPKFSSLPIPTIQNATDVIVRINVSAICGSDLHFYHQPSGSPDRPFRLGHEAVGYVSEVGDAVDSLSVGDYVIIPDNGVDGHFHLGPNLPDRFGAGGELGGTDGKFQFQAGMS